MDLPPRTPDVAAVRDAYTARAAVYIDLFGSADAAPDGDREVIAAWAGTVTGPVLDAGSGPGHWAAYLASTGLVVSGVDATPAFVEHAARTHPGIPFRVGDVRALDLPPGSLGGVLAWFSLIHLDPPDVPGVLRAFTVELRPGGTLLIGFFSGATLAPFDHAVVTAWAWPLAELARIVELAGLSVVTRSERPQPSGRVFAEITARR